jgi:ribosome-binding protein aMBF1 (putative translation factor)
VPPTLLEPIAAYTYALLGCPQVSTKEREKERPAGKGGKPRRQAVPKARVSSHSLKIHEDVDGAIEVARVRSGWDSERNRARSLYENSSGLTTTKLPDEIPVVVIRPHPIGR